VSALRGQDLHLVLVPRHLPRRLEVLVLLLAQPRRLLFVELLPAVEPRLRILRFELGLADGGDFFRVELPFGKRAKPQFGQRLAHGQLALRSSQLVIARLDLRQRLAGRHAVADVVEDGDDAPRDLGGDRRLLVAVERTRDVHRALRRIDLHRRGCDARGRRGWSCPGAGILTV